LIAATNLMKALLPKGCWYRLEGRDDAVVCSIHDAAGVTLSVGGHLGNPALALSLASFKAMRIESLAPVPENRALMPAAVSTPTATTIPSPADVVRPTEATPARRVAAPLDREIPGAGASIVEQMAALEALLGQDFEQRASWLA